jgi:hypothetical protein
MHTSVIAQDFGHLRTGLRTLTHLAGHCRKDRRETMSGKLRRLTGPVQAALQPAAPSRPQRLYTGTTSGPAKIIAGATDARTSTESQGSGQKPRYFALGDAILTGFIYREDAGAHAGRWTERVRGVRGGRRWWPRG